jgi:probable HAF family extracellular repeat protein
VRTKILLALASALTAACQSEPTAPSASAEGSSHVAAAASYTVTNLGHLSDEENTEPAAINDAGQVVGSSISPNGDRHAFIWANGVMRDLGSLGAASIATGINASGQVIGETYVSGGPHAFLWQNGTMRDLGTLGGSDSRAWGINRAGDVVGQSRLANGSVRAFIWRNGVMKRIESMETFVARAWDINNSGVITGDFHRPKKSDHAFSWKNGVLKDLGTLGGPVSFGRAINNAGTILGWSRTASGAAKYFIYRDGKMTDIGAVTGADIGARDQVVGTITRNRNPIAVVWRDGVITEVGPGYGVGINQSGWVIVRRHTATGTVAELYQPLGP